MPDGRGRGRGCVNRVFHEPCRRAANSWITGRPQAERPAPRTGRPSVRRTTSMTSSTYWSASPCSAAVRTQPWTWSSRTQDRQRVHRGTQGGRLLEDVDAVLLALDHPGDAADLALHPRQATDELGLVLRIAVAEVARVGGRWRAPLGRAHRSSSLPIVRAEPARSRMIPPGGIGRAARLRDRARSARLAADGPSRSSSSAARRRHVHRLRRDRPEPGTSASSPAATTSPSSSSPAPTVAARRSASSCRPRPMARRSSTSTPTARRRPARAARHGDLAGRRRGDPGRPGQLGRRSRRLARCARPGRPAGIGADR